MFKKFCRIYFQKLKNYLWHFPKSLFYYYYYGQPANKLTLIGITGTDGKTTTVNLIHQSLISAGIKSGVISTVGAKIDYREIKLGLHTTSPDPKIVCQVLRQMVDAGLTHVVIEVTAHALDQFRFYGSHFKVAALTNVSHEHLDDFFNLDHYARTKSRIFQSADQAILNRDDPYYSLISSLVHIPIKTYSLKNKSDYQATNVKLTKNQLAFSVNHLNFKTNSPFLYQAYNILTAHAVLQSLNVDPKVLQKVVLHFPDIKGRREIINNDLDIHCLVDFAHTPNALKNTLESIKITNKGKLIVIFGATGGRDPSKRPSMGRVVSQLADIAIVTADDTRQEDVNNINKMIIDGFDQKRISQKLFTFHNIPNRQDAFNLAIKLAHPGDTVVACGKGHETTILHGNTEYPWSESEAFRTAFRQKNV